MHTAVQKLLLWPTAQVTHSPCELMNKIIWAGVAGTEEIATVGFRFQNIQFMSFPAPVTLKKKKKNLCFS